MEAFFVPITVVRLCFIRFEHIDCEALEGLVLLSPVTHGVSGCIRLDKAGTGESDDTAVLRNGILIALCHGWRQTMHEQFVHGFIHFWQVTLSLGICFFACTNIVGQASQNSPAIIDPAADLRNKVQVRGCLAHVLDEYHFAPEPPAAWFVLTGHTAGLEKYAGREMTLEGTIVEAIQIEGYFEPIPSFEVNRVVEVFERPDPELSASFTNTAGWHVERNRKFGVKMAHPESMAAAKPRPSLLSNFVTEEGAEVVNSFEIPREAYSNANLLGGFFTIFVNRQVRNHESCMQFGQLGPREEPPSAYVVGKLNYLKAVGGSAAMGTWYSDYYFHIFQSGLCYELTFELVEYNAQNADAGCNIPLLSREDDLNLVKPLIANVSFFRPTVRPVRK
jgi:hypothetical protein